MGYVLPVSHFQYQDYKRRITQNKRNLFYIESPYKPTLDRTYQDAKSNLASRHENMGVNDRYTLRYNEACYAEITGKGRHVNIRI